MNLSDVLTQSKEIITGVGIIAGALIAAILSQFIVIKSIRKISKKTTTKIDDKMLAHASSLIRISLVLFFS